MLEIKFKFAVYNKSYVFEVYPLRLHGLLGEYPRLPVLPLGALLPRVLFEAGLVQPPGQLRSERRRQLVGHPGGKVAAGVGVRHVAEAAAAALQRSDQETCYVS